ncbi:MAG: uracil-DNA glycosylase [Gammaproteobacteria bacterium]|nr:MAG: uracil-DNA glycosylase [Gammaproteobacteria bacterium]
MPESVGESRRHRYLQAMQVDVWLRRDRAPGLVERPAAPSVNGDATPAAEVTKMALAELEATVAGCRLCDLHHGRTQTVFGTGDAQARCMIIGEAPGAEEDARGEPFVGRAGQLLNAMLRAIGLSREAVYIANIIKCRPPKNRDPKPQETVACCRYLRRQITLINPRVILAVGRVAAQHLVGSTLAIGRMRGQSYFYESSDADARIPIVVTYHPAYLLRSPLEKRKSWQDLKRVRQLLESCL